VKRDEDWREKEKKKERAEKVGTCSFLFREKKSMKTSRTARRLRDNAGQWLFHLLREFGISVITL